MKSEGYAYFMEQGTGKTPVAIAHVCNAAKARKNKRQLYRTVVVAPKNVRMNWEHEFKKFATKVPCSLILLKQKDMH